MKKFIALAALLTTVSAPLSRKAWIWQRFARWHPNPMPSKSRRAVMALDRSRNPARPHLRAADDLRSQPDEPGAQWREAYVFGQR